VTAAVVGCAPAALATTVVEPRARVSLEGRYDDDFRLNAGGTGGQMMTKLTPRLGLDVKDPTLTLESFYAADLLLRHGSGNLSLDHRGGVSVRKLLSRRLRVEVSGGLYRVTDPTSLPRESVARAAQPVLYGQARVYASGRVSRRVDVGAGYAMEGVRVLEGDNAAGFVHNPYAEGWFRASRRLSLGVEYRYQAFLYGEELDQAHGVGGALRYRMTRQATATLRAGPVSYLGSDGTRGLLPRVKLEVLHEIPGRFDLGFVAGHDLVGASGFSNSLWADYAGLVVNHHFNSRLSMYGGGSFFRNGRAPNEGAFSWDGGGARVAQGYALGAGVQFKVNEYLSVQGAVDRIAQVGMDEAAVDAVGLTRNVAAVRLHMTAF
jgi:opacity protein-like surface antigen